MMCPKCGCPNVQTSAVAETKKRGCLATMLWLFLAICTAGIILLIPLLMHKGSKTKTYAICQHCGYRWNV